MACGPARVVISRGSDLNWNLGTWRALTQAPLLHGTSFRTVQRANNAAELHPRLPARNGTVRGSLAILFKDQPVRSPSASLLRLNGSVVRHRRCQKGRRLQQLLAGRRPKDHVACLTEELQRPHGTEQGRQVLRSPSLEARLSGLLQVPIPDST